jgi:hypothetical protein
MEAWWDDNHSIVSALRSRYCEYNPDNMIPIHKLLRQNLFYQIQVATWSSAHTHSLPSPRRYSSLRALAFWTICLHSSLHPRLIIWFLNNLVLWCEVLSLTPNPNLEDQGVPLRLAPTHWPVRHGCSYQ